jgi:hypothetical protein
MTIVERASKIIFSNEGNYSSVNSNDNGALSIGKVQWHGNRARDLLSKFLIPSLNTFLTKKLLHEIVSNKDWSKRVLDVTEANCISKLINTPEGRTIQDKQADTDISNYIFYIMKYDITDENTVILLADIQNQGGAGSVKRIIENAIKKYGKYFTLKQCMDVALNDKVFKKYSLRRLTVYHKLTGCAYINPEIIIQFYTVKKGDTLSKIAIENKTTVKKLTDLNGIKDANKIVAGKVIRIK